LGAMATVFGRLGWYSRDRWSRRRKEEVERLSQCRALRAGRIGKCGADARQDSFLPSCRCCSIPLPLRMESEHHRFFLRDFIQSCKLSLLLSNLLFTLILTQRHTTAHRASLHSRDSWLSLAYAEREAHQLSSWATQLWASSEWVIWARCTPGGSPTLAGGRCEVSSESACTV
jgi:hypothetical protein